MKATSRIIATAFLLAVYHVLHGSAELYPQVSVVRMVGFDRSDLEEWEDVKLAGRSNRFSSVNDRGTSVLKAESDMSASALWYAVNLSPLEVSVVSWHWKVERSLTGNRRERQKQGDDYAARFFVIFDGDPFSRNARAICYVWAASEPVGSVYRNPFFDNVVTVVLQTGDERAGQWILEERDFVSDYRQAFSEDPRTVSAVAVMVDTDNTKRSAVSWFGSVNLKSAMPREANPAP